MIILWGLTLNPDPTEPRKPLNLYKENPMIWYYNETTNLSQPQQIYPSSIPQNGRKLLQMPVDPSGGAIAVHIAGQNIKGPEEAEGVNIDLRYSYIHNPLSAPSALSSHSLYILYTKYTVGFH